MAPAPTTSRRPVLIGCLLVGLAALAAVAVSQLTGDDPGQSGANPSGETSDLLELAPEDAADAVDCSSPCTVTGVVPFLHPSWGASSLVTVDNSGGDYGLHVVDSEGEIAWSHDVGGAWSSLAPNDPAIDDTGHLFIDFNPGRYNGMIVLEPVDGGFEDFDTLPEYGEYNTRFYYADAVDEEEDGTLEVEVSANDCDPDCAGGAVTSTVYAWDGEDYR